MLRSISIRWKSHFYKLYTSLLYAMFECMMFNAYCPLLEEKQTLLTSILTQCSNITISALILNIWSSTINIFAIQSFDLLYGILSFDFLLFKIWLVYAYFQSREVKTCLSDWMILLMENYSSFSSLFLSTPSLALPAWLSFPLSSSSFGIYCLLISSIYCDSLSPYATPSL